MDEAYSKFKDVKDGANADYFPSLKKVKSELFGIAIVTPDGKTYTKGDFNHEFAIESISKVFTLSYVLQESGDEKIYDSIGVDATGDIFNSIVAIEKDKGKEMNPFVNPRAITTTSMVTGKTADEILDKILSTHNA